MLSRAPAKISVGQVIRMLEGPLALLPCVSKTAYEKCEDCTDERTCAIRMLLKDVREATAAIFDSTSFADLIGVPPDPGPVPVRATRARSSRAFCSVTPSLVRATICK